MKKAEKKLEKRLERHKVNSELKKVVDQQEDTEEITIIAYQNKDDKGWKKVEIPITKKSMK